MSIDNIYDQVKELKFFTLNLNPKYTNINDFDIVTLIMDLLDKTLVFIEKHQLTIYDKFDEKGILTTNDTYYIELKYFESLLEAKIRIFANKTYTIKFKNKYITLDEDYLISSFATKDKDKIILLYDVDGQIQYLEIKFVYEFGNYNKYGIFMSYTNMYEDVIHEMSKCNSDDSMMFM